MIKICLLVFSLALSAEPTSNLTPQTQTAMSIEYIRYKISKDRQPGFLKDYQKAAAYLRRSPYCLGYELTQGEEEPENFILRIEWTSTIEHLEGFRKSQDFPPFLNCIRAYYNDIQEMKHYNQTPVVWEK